MSESVEHVRFYIEAWRASRGLTRGVNQRDYPSKNAPFLAAIALMYANLFSIDIAILVPCSRECFQIQQDAHRNEFAVKKAVNVFRLAAQTRIERRLKNGH
jgi:hypothetical protein